MKIIIRCLTLLITLCATCVSPHLHAQSFMPSTQQLEQFKNLPRSQQEQLARQMGFDISLLDSVGSRQGERLNTQQEVDFISREVNNQEIADALSKQSIVEEDTAKLKPFGYDIFEAREDAVKTNANMPVPSNYVIGPGDSVKLQLFGKESGEFTLAVSNEGNIDLPDLGPLQVAGSSFQELKQLVKQRYEQQKIGVSSFVSMGQIRTIQIFLVGEVYRPGPLVVSGLSTVTTALINSGGVNEIGSLRNIQLKRGGKTVASFDLYDLIVRGDTSNDLRLEQGDVVFVPTAQNIVSIDGEVRRPAIYELTPNESVADLILLAGGILPTGDANSLQLIRNIPGSGLTIFSVDAFATSTSKKLLTAGDFLRVPKANLEFQNAILVNGAINVPSIVADNNVSLSDIITSRTLYSNSDLNYALIVRKERFSSKTTIMQFAPSDVIANRYDMPLTAFDEVIIFSRVSQNEVTETAKDKANEKARLDTSQDKLADEEEIDLQAVEKNRFTTDAFTKEPTTDFSRKALLAPLISRLKSESSEKHPVQLIEVNGQVNYPGIYPIPLNNSLQLVLNAAGGLTESAHLEMAEITSLSVENGISNISHRQINLMEQMLLPHPQQMQLGSKDILSVSRIPQWFENNSVELKGEVVFPGVYQIANGETLASVIARAGGLTSEATVNAAVFSREELKIKERENIDKALEDLRQQLANNNLSNSQFTRTIDYENATQVLDDLAEVTPLGRFVINLEAIVSGKTEEDFALKDGDVLIVPNITPAISIVGEVFVATTFRFDQKLSVNDYIELAGGVRDYGDASKLYIVKANGSVEIPNRNFWFSADARQYLEPGDTIVVPRDVTNYDNISLWQGVTQILYQSAIAIAAITTL